jgi:hypothetical protein
LIAKPIIDFAVGAFGAWLEKQYTDKKRTISYTAAGPAAAVSADGKGLASKQCLVIVSGEIGNIQAPASAPGKDADFESGEWSRSWLDAFGLRTPPEVYAEIELSFSADMSALRAIPRYLEFRASRIPGKGASLPQEISAGLSISWSGVAVGVTAMTFGTSISPGTRLTPPLLRGRAPPWIPISVPIDRRGSLVPKSLTMKPMSVQVRLIESLEPTGVESFLTRAYVLSRSGEAGPADGPESKGPRQERDIGQ